MIVQSAPLTFKQRNQPNRECLYAWYPEVVSDAVTTTSMAPRDIYIHKGLDKDLLQQHPETSGFTTNCNNNNNSINDVLQRYKQSMAPSERAYHSAGTIDEALRTPWALHYEIERRPATPNLPSNTNDVPIYEEVPRRLKSAPLIRTLPPTSVLTIPEPRFVTPIIPAPANQAPPSLSSSTSATKSRVRASSARGRLNTTVTFNEEQLNNKSRQQQRRECHSAQRTPKYGEVQVLNEINPTVSTQIYTETTPQQPYVIIPSTPPPPPPPVYVYQKSATWCGNDQPVCCAKVETKNHVVLNPHYIRRPGVVSATNPTKRTVIQDYTVTRKPSKNRRRSNHHHHHHHHSRHHHHQEKRNEPMLAIAPLSYSTKVPVEIDGVKLLYDPTLTLDDSSSNLKKYLIDGRLYLIKDQRYNVVENVNETSVETCNQTHSLPPRPKYYKTIPIEKLQIPKPAPDVHYNASETFFYNTMPKRVHRYVIDPNFISENLNVNKMSLSQRPSTANIAHSTINDLNRQPTTQTTVYA